MLQKTITCCFITLSNHWSRKIIATNCPSITAFLSQSYCKTIWVRKIYIYGSSNLQNFILHSGAYLIDSVVLKSKIDRVAIRNIAENRSQNFDVTLQHLSVEALQLKKTNIVLWSKTLTAYNEPECADRPVMRGKLNRFHLELYFTVKWHSFVLLFSDRTNAVRQ